MLAAVSQTNGTEIEVKLHVSDLEAIRSKIAAAGFHISRERIFESNEVFDTKDQRLRNSGCVLRLRRAGDCPAVVTFKGVSQPGLYKEREEIEATTFEYDQIRQIFIKLQFTPQFTYEKYRTEFSNSSDPGVVMLDETPIGIFLELEGNSGFIDATAALLGYSKADYLTLSYGQLYMDYCKSRNLTPGHMRFQ